MPGPAIAGIAAGLGSAAIGAIGTSRAADAQADAAGQQMALQGQQFDRMDELQKQLYGSTKRTINKGYAANTAEANRTQDAQMGLAGLLAQMGFSGAQDTRNANVGLFQRDQQRGVNALTDTRNRNLGTLRQAQSS
jgi:phage tail protein X